MGCFSGNILENKQKTMVFLNVTSCSQFYVSVVQETCFWLTSETACSIWIRRQRKEAVRSAGRTNVANGRKHKQMVESVLDHTEPLWRQVRTLVVQSVHVVKWGEIIQYFLIDFLIVYIEGPLIYVCNIVLEEMNRFGIFPSNPSEFHSSRRGFNGLCIFIVVFI